MNLNNHSIHDLTCIIAKRSSCNVKVGAVIYDKHGIFAWGWNHAGNDGYGEHAEINAIKRANKSRLKYAHICVISYRRGKLICSRPCVDCQKSIDSFKISYSHFYDESKEFMTKSNVSKIIYSANHRTLF